MCPNCGSNEDSVVIGNVAFCRRCGPRVWASNGPGTRSLLEADAERTGAKSIIVPPSDLPQ